MPDTILPESFVTLLRAFTPCFHAPSYRHFVTLVSGWVHCLGRRTVTAVVLAAGAAGRGPISRYPPFFPPPPPRLRGHISGYHRFFARAHWSLDALGRVLFTLALAWLPANAPLYLLLDDTLTR